MQSFLLTTAIYGIQTHPQMEENNNVENVETAIPVVENPIKEEVKEVKEVSKEITEDISNESTKEETKEVAEDEVHVSKAPIPEPDPTPHDEYDWTISNKRTVIYTEEERVKYEKEYDNSMPDVVDRGIVKGKVISVSGRDVIVDVNYKSDGLLPLSDFRDMPDLKIGDTVDVYIEQKEDIKGRLILSRKKAKLLKAWEILVDSHENGTIIKGIVVSKTKGGLIANCNGLETFLPGSQIDIKPIVDYDAYVGKTMEFKVVKINEIIKNAVVSHKALIESDLAEQREAIIGSLEKGQVLEGIVKNITDFGAFMDLGGVDGLLYITDISWGRISHPSEVLELNQKINVVVLDFDDNKKRISLGFKQLQSHPWEVLPEDVEVGSVVKGKIVNIEDYGAFLEVVSGVEGLIHVSEVSWSNQPVNAKEYFNIGEEINAKVVTISREDRKMSLSIKQLTEDPWNAIENKFPVDSIHEGVVKNLTPYGVFVELNDGIGGMVHISDLSWTKRYSHPSEFTKVGEGIQVSILEIEKGSRKLSLGVKQLEENPWDTFDSVFPVGSYHKGTLVRKDDRGAIVVLDYGLEAFCPIKHIKKEDNSMAEVDEELTFKVIEFNKDDKRILVSHLRYNEDIKREAEGMVKEEKRKERVETRDAISSQNVQRKKTTLGELSGFADLKGMLGSDSSSESSSSVTKSKAKKKDVKEKVETKEEENNGSVDSAKEEVKKEKKSVKKKSAGDKGDDLKKIEGIGPKISEHFIASGIGDFKTLSETSVDKLKEILLEAGPRYSMHNPTTWPKQAELAAEGKWDELKKWQDELDGGK